MKSLQTFTLLVLGSLFFAPSAAWACGYGPVKIAFLDYLILGVTLATGFRLMVQWTFAERPALSTALYLSCYIAALGIGVVTVDEVNLNHGVVGTLAMFMIPFSMFGIRNLSGRIMWFAPQFLFALLLSALMFGGKLADSSHPKFEQVDPHDVGRIVF